jgi:Lrp/AsnC family transcriptional regulator, leucine-responsive regulatory protein
MNLHLDELDLKILSELQAHGGLSNQDLAARIGLSPSPCLRRVRQLEDAGIIQDRLVRLDAKQLGLDLTVLIHIQMDRHTADRFDAFESMVKNYPEVQECYLITGQEADYQLKVVVPDMDAYQHFLLNKITKLKGIRGVHSSFVLRKAVDTTRLPLKYVPTRS